MDVLNNINTQILLYIENDIDVNVFRSTIRSILNNYQPYKFNPDDYNQFLNTLGENMTKINEKDKNKEIIILQEIDSFLNQVVTDNVESNDLSKPINIDMPLLNLKDLNEKVAQLQTLQRNYNISEKKFGNLLWKSRDNNINCGGIIISELLCQLIKGKFNEPFSLGSETVICTEEILMKDVYHGFTFIEIALDMLNFDLIKACAKMLSKCRNRYQINCLLYYIINVLAYNLIIYDKTKSEEQLKKINLYRQMTTDILNHNLTSINLNDQAYIYFIHTSLSSQNSYITIFLHYIQILCSKNQNLCFFPYYIPYNTKNVTYKTILDKLIEMNSHKTMPLSLKCN